LKRLGYDDVNEFKKLTPSDAEKMEEHLITGGVLPGHAGKILRAARATPAPAPVETPMLVLQAAGSVAAAQTSAGWENALVRMALPTEQLAQQTLVKQAIDDGACQREQTPERRRAAFRAACRWIHQTAWRRYLSDIISADVDAGNIYINYVLYIYIY